MTLVRWFGIFLIAGVAWGTSHESGAAEVYVRGYGYVPRRVVRRAEVLYGTPAAIYWMRPAGAPGWAPSWSTLRSGLDRYPLLGGVDLSMPQPMPAATPSPSQEPALEPAPDPIASQPGLNPAPVAAPSLPAPTVPPPVPSSAKEF